MKTIYEKILAKIKVITKQAQSLLFFLAWGGIFASLLGLRGILITPVLVSSLEINNLKLFLNFLYSIGLFISIIFLWGHYSQKNTFSDLFDLFKNNFLHLVLWIILALPFVYLLFARRLFSDFWLDEMISIVRNIVPSIRDIVLSYRAPNNHVFFNLFSNIYLRMLGLNDLKLILENPFILRLPLLLLCILTIFVIGYTSYIYFGKWASYLSVVLLCTTIPWLNFAIQIRGYAFSVFFSSTLLLLIKLYKKKHKRWLAFNIIALSFLLIYTIPSNVYFILALIVFLLGIGIKKSAQTSISKISYRHLATLFNTDLNVGLMLICGIFLAMIAYTPILRNMITNKYVATKGFFQGTAIINTLPKVIKYFISNRLAIFLVSGVSLFISWINAVHKKNKKFLEVIYLHLFIILVPFLISFVRGDNPFPRTFLVTLPSFIFLGSAGLCFLIEKIQGIFKKHTWITLALFIFITIFSNMIFISSYKTIESDIYSNLQNQKFDYVEYHDTRMWASHFLEHYSISPILQQLDAVEIPIFVDPNNTRYEWVITTYLKNYDYSFSIFQKPNEINTSEGILIVSYPNRSIQTIKRQYPNTICEPITQDLSLYRAFKCQFE